eukprot:PITA_33735
MIRSYKEDLAREFEMKDTGLTHYFLGLEVRQGHGELFISQGKYANEIHQRFRMDRCKRMETPLTTNRRKEDATLDMCFAVNQSSQTMVRPTKLFWRATKNVLWYLRGITQFILWYRWTKGVKLCGITDVDLEGILWDRKSTSSGIFSVGSPTISWYIRKQMFVSLISVEAEYMDASQEACETIRMRKIYVGLFGHMMDPTVIYYDNKSCIKLSENPIFHDRSKHIDVWYHYLWDYVQRQIMLLQYIPTKEHNADILTKAMSRGKFKFHRHRIGVVDNPFLTEREC